MGGLDSGVLDTAATVSWIRAVGEVIAEQEQHLTALDRAIGDGDHGANMRRGFAAVTEKLDGDFADPAEVLKTVATTLISTVGGASGPLYGTAFLKGSMAVAGRAELDGAGVAAFIRGAADGVRARGKAEPGDKTMVDSWLPAADAAEQSAEAGADARSVLEDAAAAARKGAEETEPIVARKGRASYLGERAIGHRDPGAESTAFILGAAV